MENVILFTPQARIRMLEDMNQQQYLAIKMLMADAERLQQRLNHLEELLKSLNLEIKKDSFNSLK
jgi:hypothetical protein